MLINKLVYMDDLDPIIPGMPGEDEEVLPKEVTDDEDEAIEPEAE